MKNLLALASMAVLVLFSTGCVTNFGVATGLYGSVTEIEEGNHTYVARGVTGSAECAYVFGIPMGDPCINSLARKQLGAALNMTGGAHAYANVTQQKTVTSYIFFYVEKMTLTADVIKFQ